MVRSKTDNQSSNAKALKFLCSYGGKILPAARTASCATSEARSESSLSTDPSLFQVDDQDCCVGAIGEDGWMD
ncbi:hypothetical protein Syun_020428 [Stephania yunnanensis]|uniref:Uncharacterized protein n=1 Tax=Stephania yunnanensis TaxID=152371 RepID=A0AAP0IDW0_9MAGN